MPMVAEINVCDMATFEPIARYIVPDYLKHSNIVSKCPFPPVSTSFTIIKLLVF